MTELNSLIESIYEAAISPHLWQGVLERIRAIVEAKHAVISIYDADDSTCNRVMTAGATSDQERVYLNNFIESDVHWLRRVFHSIPEGTVVSSQDFKRITGLERRHLMGRHAEFFDMVGMQSHAFSLPIFSQDRLSAFSVHRSEESEIFKEYQVEILAILSGHLRRALRVHFQLNIKQKNLVQALNLPGISSKGMVFLNHQLEFMSANSEGLRILKSGEVLSLHRDNKIRPVLREDRSRLDKLLSDTIQYKADNSNSLALGSNSRPHPLKVSAIPMQCGEVSVGLILVDFVHDIQLPSSYLHDAYHLTFTEIDVAQLLVNGAHIGDVARIRRTRESTARWQLKCLLHKTHSRSQADLIRLLVAIAD